MSWLGLDHFVAVKAALGAQAAATRFLDVGGKTSTAHAEDSVEMGDADGAADPAPIVFHLVYEDTAGNVSQRIVTVRKVETSRAGHALLCFCHLRRRARRFALDRVPEVFDVSTGEVHRDPKAFFLCHPLLAVADTHEDRAFRLCADELTILTVVGAADGRFDPDEQNQLLVHVFDRYEDGPMDEGLLRGRHVIAVNQDRRLDCRADLRFATRSYRHRILRGVLERGDLGRPHLVVQSRF